MFSVGKFVLCISDKLLCIGVYVYISLIKKHSRFSLHVCLPESFA